MFASLILLISILLLDVVAQADNKPFHLEFNCYAQMAENSIIADKSRVSKYYLPSLSRGAEENIALEERAGDGRKSTLYFFTEEGGFTHKVEQTKTEGLQEYLFLLKSGQSERMVGLDRLSSEIGIRSLFSLPQEANTKKFIKLSGDSGERMRRVLIDALGEKVQSVKATFDARTEKRKQRLREWLKADPKIQDKTMPLEDYFETLSAKSKEMVVQKQDPSEYINQLKTCKVALGIDQKYEKVRELIDLEVSKFSGSSSMSGAGSGAPKPQGGGSTQ